MIIAPDVPSGLATIGKAAASIGCCGFDCVLIRKLPCAGRPSRMAFVRLTSSNSSGSPSPESGPNAAVHSSAVICPASSNERPRTAAAASL